MTVFRNDFLVSFNDDTEERRAVKQDRVTGIWECFTYQNSYGSEMEMYAFKYVGYVRTKQEAIAYLKGKSVDLRGGVRGQHFKSVSEKWIDKK